MASVENLVRLGNPLEEILAEINQEGSSSVDVKEVVWNWSFEGRSLIHFAALHRRMDLVQKLIVEYELDPNATATGIYDLYTPLHFACEGRAHNVTEYLTSLGSVIVDALDGTHRTPLHIAAFKGDQQSIKHLLDSGANILEVDAHGRNALMFAASQGHALAVHTILSRPFPSSDLNNVDDEGNSAFHHAFQVQCQYVFNFTHPLLASHYQSAFLLVRAGINVHIKNEKGDEALDIIREELATLFEALSKLPSPSLNNIVALEDLQEPQGLIILKEDGASAEQVQAVAEAIDGYLRYTEEDRMIKNSRGLCPFVSTSQYPKIRKFREERAREQAEKGECPSEMFGTANPHEMFGTANPHEMFGTANPHEIFTGKGDLTLQSAKPSSSLPDLFSSITPPLLALTAVGILAAYYWHRNK